MARRISTGSIQLEAQLAALQAQIDQLRKLLAAQSPPLAAPVSSPDNVLSPSTAAPGSQEVGAESGEPAALRLQGSGLVDITPIGFMDFTAVSRDANMGSGIATNFGAVPFSNTVNGNLHEHQFGAQNSRLGLRFDTKVKTAALLGYVETDFLGIVPGNVAVSVTATRCGSASFGRPAQGQVRISSRAVLELVDAEPHRSAAAW